MNNNIDPGKGYRLLKNGETLKSGDEVYVRDGCWLRTLLVGYKVGDDVADETYRRKIGKPDLNQQLSDLENKLRKAEKQLANVSAKNGELAQEIKGHLRSINARNERIKDLNLSSVSCASKARTLLNSLDKQLLN